MSSSKKESFAARLADSMQHKTRKERGFEETERALPDVKTPPESPLQLLNVSSILSHLGSRNPLPKPVVPGDVVWMLDNVAFKPSRFGSWQAEFVAAVFEGEPKCRVVDVVNVIAKIIGLADESAEYRTIEERLLPFLWDLRPGRQVLAVQKDKQLKLGPTGPGGVSRDVLKIPSADEGTIVKSDASVPKGVTGILQSWTYFAEAEGWAVVSDIDDTIKVTQTSDPIGILRETFVNTPTPISGMPELYKFLKNLLPKDTPWFYLSASPYNLYPFLREFRNKYYPPGAIMLRDISWKTIPGLLSALTQGTEEYKAERLRKVHNWFPKRKMILIGDSTQSDAEAYGEIYRQYPGWVKGILIRKATDIAAVGIQDKNMPERFKKAFKDIPVEVCHVFENPRECEKILQDISKRG